MPKKKLNLAILGATGAVGREMLKIVHEMDLPYAKLSLLATAASEGKVISCANKEFIVKEASSNAFSDIDVCLASAGSEASKKWAPYLRKKNVIYIDNSSAFRLDPDVPLVVPEVNASVLKDHDYIIGNPNCSTIQLVQVLAPLQENFGLKRVVVSTYQAVSGAGKGGLDELASQLEHSNLNKDTVYPVFARPIAGNVIPQIDKFMPNGFTREEMKMTLETRKILNLPELLLNATCVRVPVNYGHSESVTIEFDGSVTPDMVRDILSKVPHIQIIDSTDDYQFPTPIDIIGNDNTLVGRIRQSILGKTWISLWIVANNLRKGAALNAVQIADHLIKNQLI